MLAAGLLLLTTDREKGGDKLGHWYSGRWQTTLLIRHTECKARRFHRRNRVRLLGPQILLERPLLTAFSNCRRQRQVLSVTLFQCVINIDNPRDKSGIQALMGMDGLVKEVHRRYRREVKRSNSRAKANRAPGVVGAVTTWVAGSWYSNI